MPRKKKVDVVEPTSGRPILADAMIEAMSEYVAKKTGREVQIGSGVDSLHILPTPSIAMRFLLQNEGLLLSKFYHLVGIPASYKSTMAVEFLRWHRLCGGFGVVMETEDKSSPEFRMQVLRWDANAVREYTHDSMEEWMSNVYWLLEGLAKASDTKAGSEVPVCIIIDSLMGKLVARTKTEMVSKDFDGAQYPYEALTLNRFVKLVSGMLKRRPFTIVGVNHCKPAPKQGGWGVERRIGGGYGPKFQEAFELQVERVGAIKRFKNGVSTAIVSMRTYKNTYGIDNTSILVPFRTWQAQDPDGVTRCYSQFDWHESAIRMLANGWGMREDLFKIVGKQIAEIVDLKTTKVGRQNRWYSKRLGVSKSDAMTVTELGSKLEREHADVLSELYPVLGIQRRPFYKPGVEFMAQLDNYEHIMLQSAASDEQRKRQLAILQQQSNIGYRSGVAAEGMSSVQGDGEEEDDEYV